MIDISPRDTVTIILSIVAATVLAFVLYRRTSPTLPVRLRVILGVIRWLAAMIILLLVFGPIARIVRTEYRDPVIAVLVDNSRSMAYPGPEFKIEAVKQMLSADLIDRLESKADLRFYTFSERAFEVTREQVESLEPDGSRTDLAQGIRTVLDEFNVPPSAFIIFSDGAVNFGEDVANVVSGLRSPVHVVGMTRDGFTPDISLDRIEVTETAYAGTDVPVSLLLSARGTGPVDVDVAIRDSVGAVFSRRVSLSGTGAKTRVDADIDAGGIGIHDFTVELSSLDSEAVVSNNSGIFSLDVIKGKLRVLLIASAPSWDFAFARRSLRADPNIEVFSLFTGGSAVKPEIAGTVSGVGSLSELDASVAFGGVPTGETGGELRNAVSEGMGLVILGGPDGAGLDGELSPFRTKTDRGGAGVMVSVAATDVGVQHEILRLAQAAGMFSWSELPPVPVSGGVIAARDQATVLLSGKGGQADIPVLAIMRFGQGRIVGLAAYDLWRWDLIPRGFGLEASPFSQILLNSIGWLTESEEVQRVALSASKRTYLQGEPVDLFARVVDENLKPVRDITIQGEVRNQTTGEASRRFTMSERGGGSHLGRIDHLPPGNYQARAAAYGEGGLYGEEVVDFRVDARGLEDFDYDGDPALLRRISRLTGGDYYDPVDSEMLAEGVNPGVVVTRTRRELRLPLSLPVFLSLAGLLGVEWLLRKRRMLL